MIRLSIFLYILLFCQFASATDKSVPALSEFEMVMEVTEKEVMEQIVSNLEKSKIPHLRETNTVVRYSSADYQRFSEIAAQVIKNDLPPSNSISIPDDEGFALLISEFESAKISYVIKSRHGRKWVVWDAARAGDGKAIADCVVVRTRERMKQQFSRQ